MADADDFDVEELRALLRGEAPPSAGAKGGGRPAAKKAPSPAAEAKAAPGKGTRPAARAAAKPGAKKAAGSARGGKG
jgi:hypothetical protein